MLKKILATFKKDGGQAPSNQEQSNTTEEMGVLLNELKNIFAEELLIDPRIRDFEATTYGNSCRQRCNKIMETVTQVIEKIKSHIEQHKELHKEREKFAEFADKIMTGLQKSSGDLNNILKNTEVREKERQLKCYNLGMTAQQSTRATIDAYISAFKNTTK